MTDFEPRRREFLKLSAAAASALVAGAASRPVNAHSRADELSAMPFIRRSALRGSATASTNSPRTRAARRDPESARRLQGRNRRDQATGDPFSRYGYDAWGRVVREITADEVEIVWSVHVANRKAAWYEFQTALDIPSAVSTPLRNATYQGAAREELVIDRAREPSPAATNPTCVSMGDRSLVSRSFSASSGPTTPGVFCSSGHGDAYNPAGVNVTTFANNDGWCDDIADGTVRATVTIDGQSIEAEPAWVVAAPPNFGPSIRAAFTTMYDVVEQVMIESRLVRPYWRRRGRVSFTADILPLFLRLADMQWVNEGMFEDFGFGAPFDLSDPEFLLRLADPSPRNRAFRTGWFKAFRNPAYKRMQPDKLPPMYGDAVALPAVSPRQWLAPLEAQYDALKRWARGGSSMTSIPSHPWRRSCPHCRPAIRPPRWTGRPWTGARWPVPSGHRDHLDLANRVPLRRPLPPQGGTSRPTHAAGLGRRAHAAGGAQQRRTVEPERARRHHALDGDAMDDRHR